MICPPGAKSTSLLQPVGGDAAVYSAGVASLRRFSVAAKLNLPCWLKWFNFTYVYNDYIH